jgi:hypothetical protein
MTWWCRAAVKDVGRGDPCQTQGPFLWNEIGICNEYVMTTQIGDDGGEPLMEIFTHI